jgi:hypothetical protein
MYKYLGVNRYDAIPAGAYKLLLFLAAKKYYF